MGVDMGDYGYQPYHGHTHTNGSRYDGPSAYPSKASGARHQPIDLTADSPPPKKRSTKRKVVVEEEHHDDDKPVKKRKSRAKDEEKRLKRWRPKAPVSYGEIRERALTQRMFVIDRERYEPEVRIAWRAFTHVQAQANLDPE